MPSQQSIESFEPLTSAALKYPIEKWLNSDTNGRCMPDTGFFRFSCTLIDEPSEKSGNRTVFVLLYDVRPFTHELVEGTALLTGNIDGQSVVERGEPLLKVLREQMSTRSEVATEQLTPPSSPDSE